MHFTPEFVDVFLEEIRSGLPPQRGIEHQIDFTLGAATLNRPAYRSNLEETKELQRQVDELMSKSSKGLDVDEEKVQAIKELPTPTNISQPKEFVIHTNHESLKHLKRQDKLNRRHAKWMDFIETFPYMIKYKKVKENVVADVLSQRYALLNALNSKLLGFGFIKELYLNYNDFGNVFNTCANEAAFNNFNVFDGYPYQKNSLCIYSCSLHEILVKEAHEGGLIGHFRVHKTYDIPIEHF
ncbi:uncharacterized protein LOC125369825 [Ricinus communis]|uniref:uncharacterized protein LOC125369825 n=1 Tax=Ricinus communis TaxID=3988 RepID=UPI00201B1A7D|nr:uncharacterized protein LOC125369825 [Ricinus communis]